MPPKTRITREDLILAATEIVRRSGAGTLTARTVAAELGCSTQPVFSNFASMDELRQAVADHARSLYREYIRHETGLGLYPPYKAGGMAYIRFAGEEKELFKLMFMRDRSREAVSGEDPDWGPMRSLIQQNTGFTREEADLLHLEMWAFVHGIAVISASGFLKLDRDLISRMLSDAYLGIKKRFEEEKNGRDTNSVADETL